MQSIQGASGELAGALELIEAEVWADWLAAAPAQVAQRLGVRMLRCGSAVAGAAPGTDVLMANRVVALGVREPASQGTIDELLAFYEDANVARWMVQWSPGAHPVSTPALLRACGFHHHNNWVKLYRIVGNPLPEVQTELRVERIGGDRRDDCAAILASAFGFSDDVAEWCAAVLDRPAWRAYMTFDGDTPVGVGAFFRHGATAWLGFGATHPDHRRRGSQNALTAVRVREAEALGCRLIVVETAEDKADRPAPSFRNMQRFGFEVAYARPNYVMIAGTPATGVIAERR